jgi:hypothetical protein
MATFVLVLGAGDSGWYRHLAALPEVPTRFLVCRDDRFFPAGFLRRVVQDRLGVTADEIDGSLCVALGHPKELADRLEAYRVELQGTRSAGRRPGGARDQLHPLVVPHDSQTKHEPAGRIRTPQVEQ